MNMDIYTLRAKKMGVMIKQIRESHDQTEGTCAQWLGLSVNDYRSIEDGETCASLPQIESLSYFMNFPSEILTALVGEMNTEVSLRPDVNQGLVDLRNKMIAIQVRQKREELGLSLDQLEEKTSIPQLDLGKYEEGLVPIPFCQLHEIVTELGIPLEQFYATQGPLKHSSTSQSTAEIKTSSALSAELEEFITKPANLPYLELAMRISKMNADKIRGIASSLLEITY